MPSQSTQSNRYSQSKNSQFVLSGFSLFLILVLVSGVVAYLVIQTNKAKNGSSNVVGSAELAQSNPLARFFGRKSAEVVVTPTPNIHVLPTMVPRPLPKGPQEYSIQLGDGFVGPKFVKASVSDYTTVKNKKETVVIYIDKSAAASKVTGALVTDTKQTALNFSLVGEEGNLQKWQAEWTLDDTFNINYSFTFSATGAGGQSKTAIGER
jgi:hypothetical protein